MGCHMSRVPTWPSCKPHPQIAAIFKQSTPNQQLRGMRQKGSHACRQLQAVYLSEQRGQQSGMPQPF